MANWRALLLSASIAGLAGLAGLAGCGTVTQSGGASGTDGGTDAGVSCEDDSDCPSGVPVCDLGDGFCRGCEADAECEGAAGRPHCDLGSQACVACTVSAHCDGPAGSVCDTSEMVCRGCRSHSECDSGFCDIEMATCADPADIVYVDKDALVNNPCGTPATPCQGIAEGFAEAVNRHGPMGRKTVRILDSTAPYLGNVTMPANTYVLAEGALFQYIDPMMPRVMLSAGSGTWDGATFDANGSIGHRVFSCGAIAKLKVRNITSLENEQVVSMTDGCTVTIEDSRIQDGIAIFTGDPASLTVRRNFFQNNDQVLKASGVFRFENNIFVGNGVVAASDFETSGTNSDTMYFQHNTIGNHASTATFFSCNIGIPNGAIAGNIFWGVPGPTNIGCTPPTVVSNIMHPQISGSTGTPITMDPMFVNAAADEFQLSSGSPGIDAGDVLFSPSDDYDGKSRATGGTPDLGCYEMTGP